MAVISKKADVVFVGGGPVGLWTAIQTKINHSNANIVVLEKHEQYQRSHILKISSLSLPWVGKDHALYDLINDLKKKKVVPTNEIETKLQAIAHKLGIKTILNNVQEPDDLKKQFPNAKVFVGADGSHSTIRKKVCEGHLEVDKDLNFIADIKYSIKGRGKPIGSLHKMALNGNIQSLGQEHLGKYNKETDSTPVTLRVFIDKKKFEKMKENASFKRPMNLTEYFDNFDEVLLANIRSWLDSKHKVYGEDRVANSEKITVTRLGCYVSKSFVKVEDERTWCLVGDAAFGVPFFRSLNNGLLCGTQLAKNIASALKMKNRKTKVSLLNDPWMQYEFFAKSLASHELRVARIKSFFINLAISIIRFFGGSPSFNNWIEKQALSFENMKIQLHISKTNKILKKDKFKN